MRIKERVKKQRKECVCVCVCMYTHTHVLLNGKTPLIAY